jgi:hypothetical protein
VLADHPRILTIAGAGSGKTRVLTSRIVRLLLEGEPAQYLLAVTFTRKAAAEMQGRVISLLEQHGRARHLRSLPTIRTLHSWGVQVLRQHAAHFTFGKDMAGHKTPQPAAKPILLVGDNGGMWNGQAKRASKQCRDREPIRKPAHQPGLGGGLQHFGPIAWRQLVAVVAMHSYERRELASGGGLDEAMERVINRKIIAAGGSRRYV